MGKHIIAEKWRRADCWDGSFYELAISYEPHSLDTEQSVQLLQTLWSDPLLIGVIASRDHYGQPWQHVDEQMVATMGRCYGCLRVHDGQYIGCGSFLIDMKESMQLSLYIPLAIIGRIFHVEYPVLPEANPWTRSINRLLIDVGTRMYQARPFIVAAIGEEAGALSRERISGRLATDKDTDILAPEHLFRQMKIAPHGTLLAKNLWWTGKKPKHG